MPGRLRPHVTAFCTALVVATAGAALVGYARADLVVTRALLRAEDRSVQGGLERQRDCLSDRLDRLIPDGSSVRVRVAPPAAHRIIEALLPRHRIVEGAPEEHGAWLIESSRLSTYTGCLRGLRVVAP